MNEYKIGVDTATTGCISATCGDKIIDIVKYPDREYDKGEEKIIKAKIQYLETQDRSATKIKTLKAQLKLLKRRADRDYKSLYDFLKRYREFCDTIVIEEPIRQSTLGTSIDAIFANAMTLGVYLTIASILDYKVVLRSPKEWHLFFKEYEELPKNLTNKEKRDKIKECSIQICRDKFKNADDFIMEKGHKNPNDNIAESAILSLCL